jgi:serine/threonine protein kinase
VQRPAGLRALQERLHHTLPGSPVFDSAARARQLEQAFRVAVERAAQGLPPGHINTHETMAKKARRVQAVDTERLAPVRALTVDGIQYRLMHQVGVGAFSTVYKASDEWGHALVAKVYPPGIPEPTWKSEVQQLRRFAGPGVVYLHRVFVHEGYTYLLLDDAGVAVSRCRFASQPTRLQAAVRVAQGVLPALARMHNAGYCHGDISPQNVMVQTDTHQKLRAASLVDFGLCRSQAQLDAGKAAMAQWVPPPEYCLKRGLRGAALDMWHMGAVLLQVVTGKDLDYDQDDIVASQPMQDALALNLPIGHAIAAALQPEPSQRPDALGLWRAVRAAHQATFPPQTAAR